jgi:glycosyltransferase involved in cell wall biosynthesis
VRILFYDWALHTIGGGQKFNCKIAEYLSKKHEVHLITLFPVEKKTLESYYSIDLSKVNITNLYKKAWANPSFLKILVAGKISQLSSAYDLFFNADAQEIIKPRAKHSILYCHFFEPRGFYRPPRNIFDAMKMLAISFFKFLRGNHAEKYSAYCNSLYTKSWLKKLWCVDAKVIYPPVDIPEHVSLKKENLIISVGRISPDKNYEAVIEIFRRSNVKNYRLIICGKSDSEEYLEKLKKLSENLAVDFKLNLSDKELKSFYSKAKIFIQAKGMDINENKFPALFEHFGMTTAEAMSYGCVPLALNKAGYKETVKEGYTGFLFNSPEEAVEKLVFLTNQEALMRQLSTNCIKKSKEFSTAELHKKLDELISGL